jgi:hypothetical protein
MYRINHSLQGQKTIRELIRLISPFLPTANRPRFPGEGAATRSRPVVRQQSTFHPPAAESQGFRRIIGLFAGCVGAYDPRHASPCRNPAMCSSLQSPSPTFVPGRGIFPHAPPHHSNFEAVERGGASLDMLSVRCLSSYLFFSASFGYKQAASRFSGADSTDPLRRFYSLH